MEFIRRILLAATLWPLRILACPSLREEYSSMTLIQRSVLRWAYDKGKPYGFEETMRAICWQESSCGVDLDNPDDRGGGSYGRFGNSVVSTAGRYFGCKPSAEEMSYTRLRLQSDHDFAAWACLEELRFWHRKWRGDWMRIWASYNAGWRWDNGRRYAERIRAKIRFLRTINKGEQHVQTG